jgi:hypothetical protein
MLRVWRVFLTIFLLVNSVGLGLVYWKVATFSRQFPFSVLESSLKNQAEISAKLDGLQNTLTTGRITPKTGTTVLGIADLLPDKSTAEGQITALKYVSVPKNSTASVSVYKEQADFSAVVGQLVPEYKYSYMAKVGDWYLVNLADSKTGWVKASLVVESNE